MASSHLFDGVSLLEPRQPPQETVITGLGDGLSPAGPFAPQSLCVEAGIWWLGVGFQVCLRKPGILRQLVQPERARCGCSLPPIGPILGSGSTLLQLEEGKGVSQHVPWVWAAAGRPQHPQRAGFVWLAPRLWRVGCL